MKGELTMANNNNHSKNRRGNEENEEKRSSKKDKRISYNAYKSKPNDPSWYETTPELTKAVTNFSFDTATGYAFGMGDLDDPMHGTSNPGIMTIAVSPTVGWATNPNSPVNNAAMHVYSFIRHENSGNKNYDPNDYFLYLLSYDGISMWLEFLKRVYGVANTYHPHNEYFPRAVLTAMGINAKDIIKHKPRLLTLINTTALDLSLKKVPAYLPYGAKHRWLMEGVYQDANLAKAQVYAFVPEYIFEYDIDEDGAGCVVPKPFYSQALALGGYGIEELETFTQNLMDSFFREEDLGVMSGDTMKAYGSNCYAPMGIESTYRVLPSYLPEVLDQIQNLTLMGGYDGATCRVVQSEDKDYLVSKPEWRLPEEYRAGGRTPFMREQFLNFEMAAVNHGNVAEATRMTNIASVYNEVENTIAATTIGSEVANYAVIWTFGYNENIGQFDLHRTPAIFTSFLAPIKADSGHSLMGMIDADVVVNALQPFMYDLSVLCQFDRHPQIYATAYVSYPNPDDPETDVTKWVYARNFLGDLANYYVIDRTELELLSTNALKAEFGLMTN
ncbi:capsid protein [Picobirnavirus Equ3]|uniref:Capsid protein n=1 Tax=Picobirnavirus Equ3 TaxID=1673646 RepID=A0A0H4AQ74_9VIRU|nr:capsid protein [Picobirnavirus Equ3]AKN50626.1 capsid protein [Picobirnavirus Equ3]